MRRDSSDLKWSECKRKVKERDGNVCQICKCLTGKEVKETKKHCSSYLFSVFDPAHIYPVSVYPNMMYDENNVMTLCRNHHTMIDDYRDPVYNYHIYENKVFYYWWRAKFNLTDEYEETKDYKYLLENYKPEIKSTFKEFLSEQN